jgi:hypothetical protein
LIFSKIAWISTKEMVTKLKRLPAE